MILERLLLHRSRPKLLQSSRILNLLGAFILPKMSLMCQRNSYLKEFQTKVKSCKPCNTTLVENGKKNKVQGYEIVLEDTILFPEGGGQPDDRGTINDVQVLRITRAGADAVNFVQEEILPETEVSLKVDWARRFDHMQQHTSQHLVSAVVEQMFGYTTTSWDIGTSIVTVELDTTTMSSEQVQAAEAAVNERIRENIPVKPVLYQDKDDPVLKEFQTRGLPDDHVGPVRVLNIEGVDSTMCCGTHLSNLSQIQAVKLLGVEKAKKNKMNLTYLAGGRLLNYVGKSYDREKALIGILKSPAEKHAEQVEKSVKGMKAAQKTCSQVLKDVAALEASLFKQAAERDVFVTHRKDGDNEYITALVGELDDKNLPKLITIGEDKEGGTFALGGSEQLLKDMGSKICEVFEGKGAASKGVFRGRAVKLANRSEAEKLLRDYVREHGAGDGGAKES